MTEDSEVVADWRCQFGPRDTRPLPSETITLSFDFLASDKPPVDRH